MPMSSFTEFSLRPRGRPPPSRTIPTRPPRKARGGPSCRGGRASGDDLMSPMAGERRVDGGVGERIGSYRHGTPGSGRLPAGGGVRSLLASALSDVGGQRVHQEGQRLLLGAPLGGDVVLDGRGHPVADVVLIDLDLESHGRGSARGGGASITARS